MVPMPKKKRIGRPPDAEKARDVLIAFRVMPKERARYQRAADAAGLPVSDWIRNLCNTACARREGRS
jgi:hypothetical protein